MTGEAVRAWTPKPPARGAVKKARRAPPEAAGRVLDSEHGGGTSIALPMDDMSIRSNRLACLRIYRTPPGKCEMLYWNDSPCIDAPSRQPLMSGTTVICSTAQMGAQHHTLKIVCSRTK